MHEKSRVTNIWLQTALQLRLLINLPRVYKMLLKTRPELHLQIVHFVLRPMAFHLLSDDKQMKQTVLYKKMEPDSIFSLQIDKTEVIFSLLTNVLLAGALIEMSCESSLLQDHKLDWQLPKQTE